jgi:Lrp/AsnC family leucine-responsive transcriptional regulator
MSENNKIDLIDKKLLCELDINCRIPISKLAKKLRIGRNVANYRISILEKKGIISNYICSVNLGLLGYKTYKIFFRIVSSKKELEEKFVKELLKNEKSLHVIKTEGSFDYSATIAVKNIMELDEFLNDIKGKFKELIRDYEVSIIVYSRIYKLNKLLLGEKQAVKFEKYSGEEKKIKIDDKDKRILKELSQNANLSIVDLADKSKLSLDVVKYRLKSLTDNIVNSYRMMLNLNKLGYYHYVFMIRMKKATKKDEEKLVDWCSFKENVLFCTKRIGFSDFEINAAITDINDLNQFLGELKREFASFIDSYELMINSNILKLNYVPF